MGTTAQGADRGIDAHIAADDNDIGLDTVGVDEVDDMLAVHVFQTKIQQYEIVAGAGQAGQRLGARTCRVDVEMAMVQQFLQRREHARLVIYQQ